MLCHVDLVRTAISEEHSAFIIRVTRIDELGTLAVTSNLRSVLQLLVTANVYSSPILVTLMMEALRSSETAIVTKVTWWNTPQDCILHSHHRENLRSYSEIVIVPVRETDSCNAFPIKKVHISEPHIRHFGCLEKYLQAI
jgi:hypothetical protein